MGGKNSISIGLTLLFIFISPCQADMNLSSFFDFYEDTNVEMVTSADDIKYVKTNWNPDKDWEKNGYTKAWIDIVGYNGLIKYNETFYINRPHTEAVYILYGTMHSLPSGKRLNSLSAGITNRSYDESGMYTVLSTTIKYHWTVRDCHYNLEGKKKCKDYHKSATKNNVFSESDPTPPEKYPTNIILKNITAVVYNNSLYNKTIINLPQINYTLGYRLEFDGESIEYYHSVLEIEHTDDNFPYGNVTTLESNPIYDHSDRFSRAGDNIVINSSEIDNRLKMFIITPYDETQINYTVINGSKIYEIENATLSNVFSLIILGWIVIFLIKYFR